MKPFYTSNTTKAQAISSVSASGTVLLILSTLRQKGLLPWGAEHDPAIAIVIATLGWNILARLIALYRKG